MISFLVRVVCLVLIATAPRAALAQGWTVGASAGHGAHQSLGSTVGVHSASIGLHYQGAGWGSVTAGLPLDSTGTWWGAAAVGRRVTTGTRYLSAGFDLAVHGFGYRDPAVGGLGYGAAGEVLPWVAVHSGGVRLELRSGPVHYTGTVPEGIVSRTLHESGARLSIAGAGITVAGEADVLRAPEGDYPYVGTALTWRHGRVEAWGSAGQWLSDSIPQAAWDVGLSVSVAAGTELYASAQQEPNHPLFLNPPRDSWSVGISRTLGRRMSPTPILAQPTAAGVTLSLPLSASAAAPSVGGDFNAWAAVPMTRVGNQWVVTLPIPPGVYRYAFRSPAGDWFVPSSIPSSDDGMGGVSATLVVQ